MRRYVIRVDGVVVYKTWSYDKWLKKVAAMKTIMPPECKTRVVKGS